VVARVVAAVLGTISVWLTYLAGSRFFNRDVGLMAAAMFGLAFLPIFYSHLALNDVPTLAPVALSLYGVAGVLLAGFIGTPDVSIGSPYQLATITAAAIAGSTFSGGPASVASVLIASIFLQLLNQSLAIKGFSAGVQVIAQGVALVVAVAAITFAEYGFAGLSRGRGWFVARRSRGVAPPG